MGMLMIRCPITGRPFFTGRYIETATLWTTPVFFSRTYCPHCEATHEWFAKDAWVCKPGCLECEDPCEQQVA